MKDTHATPYKTAAKNHRVVAFVSKNKAASKPVTGHKNVMKEHTGHPLNSAQGKDSDEVNPKSEAQKRGFGHAFSKMIGAVGHGKP